MSQLHVIRSSVTLVERRFGSLVVTYVTSLITTFKCTVAIESIWSDQGLCRGIVMSTAFAVLLSNIRCNLRLIACWFVDGGLSDNASSLRQLRWNHVRTVSARFIRRRISCLQTGSLHRVGAVFQRLSSRPCALAKLRKGIFVEIGIFRSIFVDFFQNCKCILYQLRSHWHVCDGDDCGEDDCDEFEYYRPTLEPRRSSGPVSAAISGNKP